VIFSAIVLSMMVGVLIGVGVSRALTSVRPSDRLRIIREHTALARAASRASRRGQHGEANIYTEAAERLMKELEPSKEEDDE
jgi:hypothetical protein